MKRSFMTEATPKATLEAFWRVKRAFDPNGIMNPGKLLPDLEVGEMSKPERVALGERDFDLTT